MRYTVDVKAFINVEVEAASEDDARLIADSFVEDHMATTRQGVEGYNSQLPDEPVGWVVPGTYTPAIDGESDVERTG